MLCKEEEGVKCQKCNATLNMAQGQDAEVVRPACYVREAPIQAGGAWAFFSKLFRTQAQTVPRKMRRQVTCHQCKVRQGVTSQFQGTGGLLWTVTIVFVCVCLGVCVCVCV